MSIEQALITVIQSGKYILTLKDWYNLLFVSCDVMQTIKRFLPFGFTLNDQWVFHHVRLYGQHALYHANNSGRIELTYREVGYSPDADNCKDFGCYYYPHDEILQTPISHAIMCAPFTYLGVIVKKGLSKSDSDYWGLIRSAIQSLSPVMIRFVREMFKSESGESLIDDFSILALSAIMPDDIVVECIDIALSLGIDVNEKDEFGGNILFGATHSRKSIMYLKDRGIDLTHRDTAGNNVIDSVIRSVNINIMNGINVKFLREIYDELRVFSHMSEFTGDRENISLVIFHIKGVLALANFVIV